MSLAIEITMVLIMLNLIKPTGGPSAAPRCRLCLEPLTYWSSAYGGPDLHAALAAGADATAPAGFVLYVAFEGEPESLGARLLLTHLTWPGRDERFGVEGRPAVFEEPAAFERNRQTFAQRPDGAPLYALLGTSQVARSDWVGLTQASGVLSDGAVGYVREAELTFERDVPLRSRRDLAQLARSPAVAAFAQVLSRPAGYSRG